MQGNGFTATDPWRGQGLRKHPMWFDAEQSWDPATRHPLRVAESFDGNSLLSSAGPSTHAHPASTFSSNIVSMASTRLSNDHGSMDVDAPLSNNRYPASTSFLPTPPPTNKSPIRPASLLPPLDPQIFARAASSTTAMPHTYFSFDTRISLCMQGRPITLDLQTLENDPKVIAELLRAADTERANWMIAAVYFRRAGNPEAAIYITDALIEVMDAHDVLEQDRHPAYILLAGCESDLGKAARSADPGSGEAKKHFESSRRWLQRVYGVNVPDNTVNLGSTTASPAVPAQKDAASRAPPSLQERLKAAGSPPTAPRLNQYNQVLEREITCLRDKAKRNSAIMEELRRDKRKIEDELEDERSLRRRLEGQISELEYERDSARRMEATALQQAQQEADSRRRAQESLAEEQERRREVEGRAGRPLLEDLARLFQQTSQETGRFSTIGTAAPYNYTGYTAPDYGSQSTAYR
ncbi:hypothetical protein HDZ31DRAFT_84549 [Schizophyllum fasciatum]